MLTSFANKKGPKVLAAIVLLACANFSAAADPVVVHPEPSQTVTLKIGISALITASQTIRTVHITQPDIVDAIVRTPVDVTLVPKAKGQTSLELLDENGALISDFIVRVVQEAERDPGAVRAAYEEIPGRVTVHDQPSALAGIKFYRCWAEGCEFVNEAQVSVTPPTPATVRTTVTTTDNREKGTTTKETTEQH